MTSKQELRAEIAEWQAAYGRLAREYVEALERVTLPADTADELMDEADQADEAPKLAEAAAKPRAFGPISSASIPVPIRAICGCSDPDFLLHASGLIECAKCVVPLCCSGNSDVPCDTEHGNNPNIEDAA